jgi:glycosidase
MYQINPRVFAPQNAFRRITERMDSIRDLGVNVLWFMPVYEIGKEKTVNSPYCIKDYCALNPEFGTLQDLATLVKEAHKRKMYVIMDWVPNHTSWDSDWLKEHKDWYTQDSIGNVISPAGTGWNDVADLNFDNAEMRLAMIDAMKFWIREAGIDGYRCDAADYVPFDFWKQALDSLRATGRPLLMLAEGKRPDHFAADFDMNYAWDYLATMRRIFRRNASVATLFDVDIREYEGVPEGARKLRFTTNHDEGVRTPPVREFVNERGAMAAFVATAYLHGGMLIYDSQEVGFPRGINFFQYVPVDWNANPDYRNEYKHLIALYKKHPAIRSGNIKAYPDENIMLFEKWEGRDQLLIAINLRNAEHTIALPAEWTQRTLRDLASGKDKKVDADLTLAPFEYLILQQK